MSFQSQLCNAFRASIKVFRSMSPGSCTLRMPVNNDGTDAFGATDYDCIQAPSPDTLTLVAGGFLNDYQFSVTCLKDDFNTLPIAGTLFLRFGRVSRVLIVQDGTPGVDISPILYLHCGAPNK